MTTPDTDTSPRTAENRESPRILVVDDEPDIRDVVVSVLRAALYDVDEAADGVEALGLLGRRPYALVVSDLTMPGLDGPGLYREMRRCLRTLPRIIFVTGELTRGPYAKFLAEVEAPVLPKPFHLSTIVSSVRRALGDS